MVLKHATNVKLMKNRGPSSVSRSCVTQSIPTLAGPVASLIPRWLIVLGVAECAVTLAALGLALCFPSSRQSVLEILITVSLMAWFAARKCNEYVFGLSKTEDPDQAMTRVNDGVMGNTYDEYDAVQMSEGDEANSDTKTKASVSSTVGSLFGVILKKKTKRS